MEDSSNWSRSGDWEAEGKEFQLEAGSSAQIPAPIMIVCSYLDPGATV